MSATRKPQSIEAALSGRDGSYIERMENRFSDKYEVDSGCWIWTATIQSNGYGLFTVTDADGEQSVLLAHRVSYYIHKETDAVTSQINHTCHNTKCVNPDHLYEGTPSENMKDASRDGELGWKLSHDEVDEIRETYATTDVSMEDLADEYGVSSSHVSNIINNKTRNY